MPRMDRTDVLVVGAGPTGLTAACELLRRGLSVRLVDRAAAASERSRANLVQARALEILDDLGLAEDVVARGVKLRGATMWAGGEVIASVELDELESRFPFAVSLSQAELEAALIAKLEKLGGRVERGVELVSFRQDGTGVTATLRSKESTEEARAAWLVGADGTDSTVRERLEMPFSGASHDEAFWIADVAIRWDIRDDRISTWLAEEGLVACFPMKGGRWRVLATEPEGDEGRGAPTLEDVQTIFERRTSSGGVLSDATWLARYRASCRQVEHYRDDRVFLAGDAAHAQSPIGAQGMNTGIQDAQDLAWKLALVHRGYARGLLLDGYETERRAVGQAMLKSSDPAAKLATIKNPVARAVRTEIGKSLASLDVVQQRVARDAPELSVGYESSPLVREDKLSMLQARIGTAAGGETPTLAAIRDFESGPRPGSRAPDGRVSLAGAEGTKRLAEIVDGRTFTLLLFDGRHESDAGYQRYAQIHDAVAQRYGARVQTYVVTPRPTRPPQLPDSIAVLLDRDAELEKRFAATTECLYLIRPDFHIGYRSQPIDAAKLEGYLRSLLRPQPAL